MTRLAPLPLLLALVLAAPAPAASIRQLPGRSACVEMRGDLGCAKGNGTQGANAVVVAPGGRQVYAVSGFEDYGGLLTFARNPRTGALKQLPGRHGCVSNDGRNAQAGLDTKHGVGVKGHCAKARGLADAADLVISPDGRTIYTVGSASFRRDGDSIAVFRRDPATGWVREVQCWTRLKSRGCHATPVSEPRTLALTPDGRELLVGGTGLTTFRVGASGRLSTPRCTLLDGALEGDCPASAPRDNRILAVDAMAPSPDGATIYAVTGDFFQGQVVSFTRDATTGVLTLAGCTGTVPADAAPGSCTPGRALQSPQSLTVAPDGRGVYVAANYVESNEGSPDVLRSSALLTFTATPFGQLPGPSGCVEFEGRDDSAACSTGGGFYDAQSVAMTPDGRHVVAGFSDSNAVLLLNRDPQTQRIARVPGKAGCAAERRRFYAHRVRGCGTGRALYVPIDIAVSPDGRNAYVASDDGIAAFALR